MALESYTGFDAKTARVQNVGTPTASTDAPNRQYVDDLVNGLAYKDEVRAATTAAGTLATSFAAGQTVDGVTLVAGDRILIKDQASSVENGIYIVPASGAPTRSNDANSAAKLNNATVYVTDGTTNGPAGSVPGREYTQVTKNPTVGTSNIVWTQKAAGSAYTVSAPLQLSGNNITLPLGTGLVGDATSLRIDTSTVVRKYSTTNAAGTSNNYTHNLGTTAVDVTLIRVADGVLVNADVTVVDANNISVGFGSSQSAGAFRVLVMG